MDDAEIERLRKEICRSYNSSPHKKKYWLALLEMYSGVQMKRRREGGRRLRNHPFAAIPRVPAGGNFVI